MAEDQEMSMNEILSSIRQILSDDIQSTEPLDDTMEDVFVLTSAMKYQENNKPSIQEKLKLVLNKLAEHKANMPASEYQYFIDTEVRPVLKEWLNECVPSLIEKIIDQEIKKLLK